jgi:hypothetical protein
MEPLNNLQATPSRKESARKPKGEPEITTVKGCNGWFGVRKQETKRKRRECREASRTGDYPRVY